MTLISYLSRVHFADGVLEDALHSELELNGLTRPFVMYPEGLWACEFSERVMSGLPIRSDFKTHDISKTKTIAACAAEVVPEILSHNSDVLIAFGSAHAIGVAGSCRQTIDQDRDDSELRFFAIPGVDGLPNFSRHASGGRVSAQPSVIICDPTLTIGEAPEQTASAAVNALSRCIEAYLSEAYNPPADGIALDGLTRSSQNLHENLRKDTLHTRRELMAAALDGALAQQKGTGLAQVLADALSEASGFNLDEGAVKRILLPEVLNISDVWAAPARKAQIRAILGIDARKSLSSGVKDFMSDLPLPETLDGLGVTKPDLSKAARKVMAKPEKRLKNEAALMSMMSAVYAQECG